MTLRTIQDRVLLEPIFADALSAGGIYLGEGEMTHAKVLAAGPKALSVKPGDLVRVLDGTGTRTKSRSQRILVVREDDIFAVIEE